ncbi:MAG: right-handed parallel beta-helix repeat-containing protein [Candidatus Heimdallarchaeaceae archaeon]
MELGGSSNNTFTSNTITNSSFIGIELRGSSNNTFTSNTITHQ